MYKKVLSHFRKTDPILHKAAKKLDPFILQGTPDLFMRLVRAIVGQQLSVKAAQTIFSRFEKLFKNSISAEAILKLKDDDIRACGISYPKIKYLKDLSEKVRSKELILETLIDASEEAVILELTKVKGIGVWSAEMFLMFALGREDIFSAGDMGLCNAIKKLYRLESPSKEEILKLSEKWKPYRTYACRILWESLDNKPK